MDHCPLVAKCRDICHTHIDRQNVVVVPTGHLLRQQRRPVLTEAATVGRGVDLAFGATPFVGGAVATRPPPLGVKCQNINISVRYRREVLEKDFRLDVGMRCVCLSAFLDVHFDLPDINALAG